MSLTKTIELLEFDKVLEVPAGFASTEKGVNIVAGTVPLLDINGIKEKIDKISECVHLFSQKHSPYVENIEDLSHIFKKVRPYGAVLESTEILQLKFLLNTAIDLSLFVDYEEYPLLSQMFSALHTHKSLRADIDKTFEANGDIKDSASFELSRIRRDMKVFEKKLRNSVDNILKRKSLKPHLQDTYFTERNGRFVVPLKSNSKGHLPGVLHDISNRGETIFVEPFETQIIGNDLESLKAEEKLEMFRILQRLSDTIRKGLSFIESDYDIVCEYDALSAFAVFSAMMDMRPPVIDESNEIKLLNARHPLLWKRFTGMKKNNLSIDELPIVAPELVPLDFTLGGQNRCIVISGSNAGGKTVALKTVGVLHLMAMSGLHIPADEGSSVGFFEDILVDIGDEQSIEENLSTFSAHITHIAKIMEKSSNKALVLIDELGTGTDPEEGGALSTAILIELYASGALCAVTTHLRALKAFAHSQEGFVNAAMEMDTLLVNGKIAFKPSYRLTIGQPGQSYAFEIAKTIGIPERIIESAKSFVDYEGLKMEALLNSLKEKQRQCENEIDEAYAIKKEAESLREELKHKIEKFKKSKDKILLNAYDESSEIIKKTRQNASEIIKEIKQAEKQKASQLARSLDRSYADIKKKKDSILEIAVKPLANPVVGQSTFVKGINLDGVIVSIDKKRGKCIVLAQGKEVEVSISALGHSKNQEKVEESPKEKIFSRLKSSGIAIDRDMNTAVSMELKLIGKRVDPALSELDRYLNDAFLEQHNEVKIIHGFGTGMLGRAVKEFLTTHPLVKSFKKGSDDEGADAVTIVQL